MIGKKVKNPKHSSSKSVRIQRLVDYVRNPEKKGEEKAVYTGTRSFVSEDERVQKQEMEALAHAAARSRDPITHYVLSWKEGEEPSWQQVERSVDVVLDELKMKEHQVVYALHADTRNWHLHLVVNRVHPETEHVASPNRGKDIELLHRAVARIEKEQGWEREPRGRYRAKENGEVERVSEQVSRGLQPKQENRDREIRTGETSAERRAQETGARVIREARSWQAAHEGLAREGFRFERKGSGAVLFVGEIAVKASVMGKEFSLKALEKRLGAFVGDEKGRRVLRSLPEPLGPPKASWAAYQQEKQAHVEEKQRASRELKQRHASEKRILLASGQEKRAQLYTQDWKGRGRELNLQRSLQAGEQAQKKAELKEQQGRERAALRAKYPTFPFFARWREMHAQERSALASPLQSKNRLVGERNQSPQAMDIRDFRAVVVRQEIRYQRKEEVQGPSKTSFVDKTGRVDVHELTRESVRAALQLSAEKWGSFRVEGQKEFVAHAVSLAAEHGFRITNPELQARIEQERREIFSRSPHNLSSDGPER